MKMDCPVCGAQSISVESGDTHPTFECFRCGDFALPGRSHDICNSLAQQQPRGRSSASHLIRRRQKADNRPAIDEKEIRILWGEPLPNPQRQMDNLVLLLGEANLPLNEYLRARPDRFCAEIGTEDSPTKNGCLNLVLQELEGKGLIKREQHTPSPDIGLRLTFEGWSRYERLRHEIIESKTAFMAMSFGNAILDGIVEKYFVPAVQETGFELHRLDSKPKAGLIDNRMRVEIRTAKFLVCDLTDENRGAYWEGGFAEGLGRPVFYTCEKSKFNKVKTHFDTEHLYTVLWEKENPEAATEELKTAIRNQFPAEAK
jgi:hypothetical protein